MWDHLPDLLRTKIELVRRTGRVEDCGDHLVLQTPDNPRFYHGNLIVLAEPPEALTPWAKRFEEALGETVEHITLVWPGTEMDERLVAEGAKLGLYPDPSAALVRVGTPTAMPDPGDTWQVRPLDFPSEEPHSVELALACDPAEEAGSDHYRAFKSSFRNSQYAMVRRGDAQWWGGFLGDQLVAQCGFVPMGELGRYRAVETHPAHRRRGVCSALIYAVGQHAVESLGVKRLVLEADAQGAAVGLYRRLGFEDAPSYQCVVRGSDPLEVRPEAEGEATPVRALLLDAFPGPGEADLVDALRSKEDCHGFVAIESGYVRGHVFYTPVTIEGPEGRWTAIALGPMAVRSDSQGRGIGTELMNASLEQMRAMGYEVCIVLGHPSYYPRAGFVPASGFGLHFPAPVPDEAFMVKELVPGAMGGRTGTVHYHPAFAELA